ncbi:basic proline-rich protein-like [Oenanthe melanoleuca]|uniref:basic proline-rich protein-like n=1 Tax=Oenanthe melanoleuca TaxID=2939378 RepID=UPI0024C15827|nr:basic proline-rich protein-like [Oenanthe melanoleuca]
MSRQGGWVPGEKRRRARPKGSPTVPGPVATARFVQSGPQGTPEVGMLARTWPGRTPGPGLVGQGKGSPGNNVAGDNVAAAARAAPEPPVGFGHRSPADKPLLEQRSPGNREAASSLPPRHLPGGVRGQGPRDIRFRQPPESEGVAGPQDPTPQPSLPGYRDTVRPPSPVPVPLRGQEQRGSPATLRGAERAAPPASRPPHPPPRMRRARRAAGDTARPRSVPRGCAPPGHNLTGIPLLRTALLCTRAARPDVPGLNTVPRQRSGAVLRPLLTPHSRAPARPPASGHPRGPA